MNFVLRINWVILLISGISIYFAAGPVFEEQTVTDPHFLIIDFIVFAGILLLQAIFLLKIKALYGFSLVMLYALALVIGLRIMLSIDQLLSLMGIISFLLELLAIIYLIGVRGFLRSNRGREAMGLEPVPQNGLSEN